MMKIVKIFQYIVVCDFIKFEYFSFPKFCSEIESKKKSIKTKKSYWHRGKFFLSDRKRDFMELSKSLCVRKHKFDNS